MSAKKARVTITLDPHLVALGNADVRAGRAGSLSEWINGIVAERAAETARQRAARAAARGYARAFGALSRSEVDREVAALRRDAIEVRPRAAKSRRGPA